MLHDWQKRFAETLRAAPGEMPAGDVQLAGAQAHRLSVYRDNVVGSLVDALGETFPVVRQLVGDAFFSAVAADFVRDELPEVPRLSRYGAAFPTRLRALPQLVEVSYVGDVAVLEWARVEAYFAGAASTVLTADKLLAHPPDLLPQLKFKPVASLRIVSTPTAAYRIWLAHQTATPRLDDLDPWQGEAVRLLCAQAGLVCQPISLADAAFITALMDGSDLTGAAETAMDVDDAFDLQSALSAELAAGSFSDIELPASDTAPQH
jgi:hypothetical protein